jgi:hypothetical protein
VEFAMRVFLSWWLFARPTKFICTRFCREDFLARRLHCFSTKLSDDCFWAALLTDFLSNRFQSIKHVALGADCSCSMIASDLIVAVEFFFVFVGSIGGCFIVGVTHFNVNVIDTLI